VALFVLAGYYFGAIPAVQDNFHVVIIAIIVLSVLPIVVEAVRLRLKRGSEASLEGRRPDPSSDKDGERVSGD
jgi:membrane protein DedA with SNARE-associated domain